MARFAFVRHNGQPCFRKPPGPISSVYVWLSYLLLGKNSGQYSRRQIGFIVSVCNILVKYIHIKYLLCETNVE